MHSFRSGGAISQALAGETLASIMQRAFWKRPSTVWIYMRLMQVVAPGSESQEMIKGISEEQFRHINGFPLSEQSKSWTALGKDPRYEGRSSHGKGRVWEKYQVLSE